MRVKWVSESIYQIVYRVGKTDRCLIFGYRTPDLGGGLRAHSSVQPNVTIREIPNTQFNARFMELNVFEFSGDGLGKIHAR